MRLVAGRPMEIVGSRSSFGPTDAGRDGLVRRCGEAGLVARRQAGDACPVPRPLVLKQTMRDWFALRSSALAYRRGVGVLSLVEGLNPDCPEGRDYVLDRPHPLS